MKLYAVIGTITPGCGVYIHLYGLHADRKAAERRRCLLYTSPSPRDTR